jgi:hypothetical protein
MICPQPGLGGVPAMASKSAEFTETARNAA